MKQEKGVMWTVEAFLALLIILILVPAYMPDAPEGQNWPEFSDQVTAEDITYTLYETGLADENVNRGYTGNIEAAANIYSNDRLEVSGELEGVPSETLDVAFYAKNEEVEKRDLFGSPGDGCSEDDFDNLHPENEDPEADEIYSTVEESSEKVGTDPDVFISRAHFIEGNSGDYEMFWISDSSCSTFEGPFFKDELFQWDNSDAALVDEENFFYSADWSISDEEFVTFEADNITSIGEEIRSKPSTETSISMFNSSVESFREDIGDVDTVVLRHEDADDELGIDWDEEKDYFEDRNLLLMMDAWSNSFGFTGLSDEPSLTGSPSIRFIGLENSRKLENYFEQTEGELDQVSKMDNRIESNRDYLPNNGALVLLEDGDDFNHYVSFRPRMKNDLNGSAAAISFSDNYNEDDVKMIGSLIKVLSDSDSFGDSNGEIVTRTAIPGQLEGETLTPYHLELRWFR